MNEVIFVFSFEVKPENQERYDEVRQQQFEISKSEKGTLLYEVYRDENGVYCQHERYANEAAAALHIQNTAEQLQEWYTLVELKQVISLGQLSDAYKEQFQLKEVYAPYARVEK
ncbi:antibiotic biosynthesis monooxygenase [Winogradskyella sp.]|jgi:quinol monooxygenase YgiN|uniref:putative quinol monooxygenase n=1 Tax=Winogradskyella sp. TaxID=1883156 RepID=UPI0025D6731C|nr:antibiotic biosynthesis monooxygenase [Winogradskyella sp.]MCT4629041.1 antibiotic biosynthesis monooxygenase [Winogradskyella sp.]